MGGPRLPQDAINYMLANPEMEADKVVLNLAAKGIIIAEDQIKGFWARQQKRTQTHVQETKPAKRKYTKRTQGLKGAMVPCTGLSVVIQSLEKAIELEEIKISKMQGILSDLKEMV